MKKQFKDLTFTDDFMFCHVMQNNEELCKRVAVGYNVYKVISTCETDSRFEFDDGAARYFVNAEKVCEDASPELKNIIEYIGDGNPRDSLTRMIEECVEDARLDTRCDKCHT